MRRPRSFADRVRLPPVGGIITRVSSAPNDPASISLRIGRASTARFPAAAVPRAHALEGADWSPELREVVLRALALLKAREYAQNAAVRRSLTRRQVQTKLTQRGLSLEDARAIAEDLAARSLIDEPALARHLAEIAISRKGAGKPLIIARLRRRGIDARTAEHAASAAIADSGVDPRDSALELARKKARSLPRSLDARTAQRRIYAFLARRGFDPETCAQAAKASAPQGAGRSTMLN